MAQPPEREVIAYLQTLSNWGRWGIDDVLGTLNFITHEKRVKASSLVSEGRVIQCSRPILIKPSPENPKPLLHHMLRSGDSAPATGRGGALDWFGMDIHSGTHFDALAHYFWNRQTYNGRPASIASTANGAEEGNIEAVRNGVVSRGVLLDIPRSLSVPFLDAGYAISPEELERCEQLENVAVESGDVLIVRTGWDLHQRWPNDARAGLGADCLPWLHRREVAVLVGDSAHDLRPAFYESIQAPIHTVGIVAMGLQLIDKAYVEDLADYCASSHRWEFEFVASPLRLDRSTGSPTNPLAIF